MGENSKRKRRTATAIMVALCAVCALFMLSGSAFARGNSTTAANINAIPIGGNIYHVSGEMPITFGRGLLFADLVFDIAVDKATGTARVITAEHYWTWYSDINGVFMPEITVEYITSHVEIGSESGLQIRLSVNVLDHDWTYEKQTAYVVLWFCDDGGIRHESFE